MDSKPSDTQNATHGIFLEYARSYRTVLLTDIDSGDRTFRVTTRDDNEDLIASIRQVGLIQPPVLIARSAGYSIVCGFRRIAACRQASLTRITAGVLGKRTDRFKAAQVSIADNAFQRSLNLVETSRALKLLEDFSPDDQQRITAAAALGLPTSRSVVADIKRICHLPLQVQEGILTNTIDLSMALELGGLDRKDAAELVSLFEQLKIGLNKQRELLLLTKESAERDNTTILKLLTAKSLQEILKDVEMDGAVKRQKVRSYFRQRRFPSVTKAEDEYRKRVKQLKLGNHIVLIPPKDFEGNTFSMTLRFHNRRELDDLKKRLDAMVQHPALGKILD